MAILGRALGSGENSTIISSAVTDPAIIAGDVGKFVVWIDANNRFELMGAGTSLALLKGESWGLLTSYISSGLGVVALGGSQNYTITAGSTLYWEIGDTAPQTTLPTGPYARIGVAPATNVLFIEKEYEENIGLFDFKGHYATAAALEVAFPAASNAGAWAVVDNTGADVASGLYEASGTWTLRIQASDLTSGIIDALKNAASTPTAVNPFVLDDDPRFGGAPASHAASHTDGSDDIQDATTSQKGLMTIAQATKLDGIETGAQANTVDSVNGLTGAVSLNKIHIGLSLVDNTADVNKPVSGPQQTALDLKADDADLTAHTGNTSNPHSVTQSQVGLGLVQNVSADDWHIDVAGLTNVSTDHTHNIRLTRAEMETLISTGTLAAKTSETAGSPSHTHDVTITFNQATGAISASVSQASGAGHAGADHDIFMGAGGAGGGGGGNSFSVTVNTGDWTLVSSGSNEPGYETFYEYDVVHNFALADQDDLVISFRDTAGWQVMLDSKSVDTNTVRIFSVVTLNDLTVSVR